MLPLACMGTCLDIIAVIVRPITTAIYNLFHFFDYIMENPTTCSLWMPKGQAIIIRVQK